MWLMIVFFSMSALSRADNLSDSGSPWSYLKLWDVLQFEMSAVEEKLSTSVRGILPQPNVAENPLNKFVDGKITEMAYLNFLNPF